MARTPFTIPLEDGPVSPWLDRTAAVVVVGSAAVLTTALLRIAPDARGFGTHERLGMAPCGWPLQYGMPCPTCGCTTAACLVLHGHLIDGFAVQPFGALLAIAGLLLGVHALRCLVQRRSFADLLVRVPVGRVLLFALAALLLAWGYKCLVFER